MTIGVVGRKVGMTRVFTEDGASVVLRSLSLLKQMVINLCK